MEDFVFEPWELDCESYKHTSIVRWITKESEDGSERKIMISLSLGKGDNPTKIGIHDFKEQSGGVIDCDNIADALNKIENFIAVYLK